MMILLTADMNIQAGIVENIYDRRYKKLKQ